MSTVALYYDLTQFKSMLKIQEHNIPQYQIPQQSSANDAIETIFKIRYNIIDTRRGIDFD
jgi:hypothetical protein